MFQVNVFLTLLKRFPFDIQMLQTQLEMLYENDNLSRASYNMKLFTTKPLNITEMLFLNVSEKCFPNILGHPWVPLPFSIL